MDLTTSYLGMTLKNPLVASASPLSQTVDGVRELADGGVGAIVMYSLMEEQLRREAERDMAIEEAHEESFAEALSYFPDVVPDQQDVSHRYVALVEKAARAVNVPVIASLNGTTMGSWVEFATQLEDAGAAAIELNIYYVAGDTTMSSADVEQRHLDIAGAVKSAVGIPVAVKLSPYFSSMGQLASRLVEVGVDGLVMFNRFLQPEIDVEQVAVVPEAVLSSQIEGRLPRTWIAALANVITSASLAATSGVEEPEDVVRYLLAGADVVMTTSALLRHGPAYAGTLLYGLEDWMTRKGYGSVADFRGLLAVPGGADGSGYQRAGYVAALERAKAIYGSLTA